MKWIIALLLIISPLAKADPFEGLRQTTLHLNAGTGFLLHSKSGNNYIITNAHVCMFSKWKGTLAGTMPEGKLYVGKIVKEDVPKDLCAAKVDADVALQLAERSKQGETVFTRGYPAHILCESSGKLGPISNWEYPLEIAWVGECPKGTRSISDFRRVQVQCLVKYHSQLSTLYGRPGSSGSPVVNEQGYVVGVLSSFMPGEDYEAGMVTLGDLKTFMEGL